MPFYLGRDSKQARFEVDPDGLTTHGVIVGMTGSGKTGLGVVLLEEALRLGVPVLAIDPKGDLGNLALRFPALGPSDFQPWLPAGEDAGQVARRWKEGLARDELAGADISALDAVSRVSVYTPGLEGPRGVNVFDALTPQGTVDDAKDFVEGTVSGLLALAGYRDVEPLTSREHVLLSHIVNHAIGRSQQMTVADLVRAVPQPPFRQLGVFELDTFFPEKDRMALAMRLNTIIAATSFSKWSTGATLDVEKLLARGSGKVAASVFNIQHLDAVQRQFFVSWLLGRVTAWMRGQPGHDGLRGLIYVDEAVGFVPPTAMPPSKGPIMTLLKQARAFGVGVVLATQNPADLDYKALSNTGTWMVGRLHTEQDRARLLDGMELGDAKGAAEQTVANLDNRQFVAYFAKQRQLTQFRSRFAMSFLRGPMTAAELGRLPHPEQSSDAGQPAATPSPDAVGLSVMPKVADGVPAYFVRADSPWLDELGVDSGGNVYQAGVAVRLHLTFDDTKAELDESMEWESVLFPAPLDPATVEEGLPIDYDDRDFVSTLSNEPRFVAPDAAIDTKTYFRTIEKRAKDWVYRNLSKTIYRNPELKLYSRVGESEEDFLGRCEQRAAGLADVKISKLRDKYEKRFKALQKRIRSAEARLETAEARLRSQKQDEVVSGAGALLSVFLGGGSRSKISRAAGKIRGVSSRRARTSRGNTRVERAKESLEDLHADVDQLELELGDDIEEIQTDFQDKASETEEFEVRLEKNDIDVARIAVIWVPNDS